MNEKEQCCGIWDFHGIKIKIAVFWTVTLQSFVGVTNFSEVPSIYIEMEDEGSSFLQNASNHLQKCSVTTQKTMILKVLNIIVNYLFTYLFIYDLDTLIVMNLITWWFCKILFLLLVMYFIQDFTWQRKYRLSL
jgi:hypothetical protein